MTNFKIGDTVQLTKYFLQCTGQLTGSEPTFIGNIKSFQKLGSIKLATINAPNGEIRRFNVKNLETVNK